MSRVGRADGERTETTSGEMTDNFASRISESLQHLIFPEVCPSCRHASISVSTTVCHECAKKIREFSGPYCSLCGGATDNALDICGECLRADNRVWDDAVSVFPFGGEVRELIHRFKYSKHLELAPFFAERMAAAWRKRRSLLPDVIVPVPLHWYKALRRGYNQSELLALYLQRQLDVPVGLFLSRRRWTSQQAKLDFSSRQINMKDVFTLNRYGKGLHDKHVLLVDDVMTTGATLADAASRLKACPNVRVSIITVARG